MSQEHPLLSIMPPHGEVQDEVLRIFIGQDALANYANAQLASRGAKVKDPGALARSMAHLLLLSYGSGDPPLDRAINIILTGMVERKSPCLEFSTERVTGCYNAFGYEVFVDGKEILSRGNCPWDPAKSLEKNDPQALSLEQLQGCCQHAMGMVADERSAEVGELTRCVDVHDSCGKPPRHEQ